MFQNIKEFYSHKLAASDGEIGHIKDFYFDDQHWAVRYLVADTGTWLTDRLVLISPHAFGKFDRDKNQLHINLTRAKIEQAPSADAHRPVSLQYETDYYAYYGWPTYWTGGLMWGTAGYPTVTPPEEGSSLHHGHNQRDDLHLRSTKGVEGYDIQATDGSIGSVSGFMVDDKSWAIKELIVETGHWYSGKEILISPSKIKSISYTEAKVFVKLSKADIRHTAENNVAKEGA
jgi:uncharacterized protein YrrD